MVNLKKNIKLKKGYSYTALYDFNNKETYLISKQNGDLLLSGNVAEVDYRLGGALGKLDLLSEQQEEVNPELFDYQLFDDYQEYLHYKTIYIEVTDKCNFNCVHCYAQMGNKGNRFLSIKDTIEYIKKIKELESVDIRITGGEPFLNPDIKEILFLISSEVKPLSRHSIVTNGTADYEDLLYALKLGFSIQISLYGMSVDTFGRFARANSRYYYKIFDNLHKLSETEYVSRIICLFSINSYTYDEMIQFVYEMKKLGMTPLLNRPASVGRASENWELLKLTTEQHLQFSRYSKQLVNSQNKYCYHACNLSIVYIDIDGNSRPCAFIRSGYSFGNIKKMNFSELRQSEAFLNFKKITADSFEKCNKCELEFLCTGGCCGETLAHTGKITNCYPWCNVKPYENIEYTLIDDHMIKRAKKYAGGTFEFSNIN